MLLCNFIKEHNNWQTILSQAPYFIKYHFDTRNPKLCTFNYDLIKGSDFSNPIVKECRGVIIDIVNCKPVCYPFNKFGNYGESYVDDTKIDWKSAYAQEKIDGSIIKVWFDKDLNSWRFSSNSVFDLELVSTNNFNPEILNFQQQFDEAVKNLREDGYIFNVDKLNKDYTYIFELVGMTNQVLIKYEKSYLYHLGTRNNITEKELELDLGLPKPKKIKVEDLQDCKTVVRCCDMIYNNNSEIKSEGIVVCDKYFNRMKMKTKGYLENKYFAGTVVSDKKLLNIILIGEQGEFLARFPHYTKAIEKLKDSLNSFKKICYKEVILFNNIKENYDNEKDQAIQYLKVSKLPIVGFNVKKGIDLDSYFKTLTVNKYLNLFKKLNII